VSEPQHPPTEGSNQVTTPVPQPGWGQPAQTGWVMPGTVAQGPGNVSLLVIVAALFLILAGLLTALGGAAVFLGGNLVGQIDTTGTGNGFFGALGGFIAGVAVVVIVWALLEILGAFGMLFRRGWGRAIGFIVGIIGGIFSGLVFVASAGSLGKADGNSAGAVVAVVLVLFLGYVLTVFALIRGGGHFRRG
jgi:hypothetical protein